MHIIDWFNRNAGVTMALPAAVYTMATLCIVLQSRFTHRIQTRQLRQAEALELSRIRL